jgi:Carboxypeptidase regulatory-like domain
VAPGILVSGCVTRGGTPSGGVRLRLFVPSHSLASGPMPSGIAPAIAGPERGTAVTAEDGSYSLVASSTGEHLLSLASSDGREEYGLRRIDVPDSDTFALDVEIGGASVSGIVADRDTEAPIAGAQLGLSAPGRTAELRSTEAGPDGRFRIDAPPGDYRLDVSAPGYGSDETRLTLAGHGAEVRVVLAPGRRLRGRVVGTDGRPVAVPVTATPEDPSRRGGGETMSGPDGSFAVDDLAEGRYTLLAGAPLSGFAMGSATTDASVTLPLGPLSTVEVRLRQPDGATPARVCVAARRWNGQPIPTLRPLNNLLSACSRDPTSVLRFLAPAGHLELKASTPTAEGSQTIDAPPDAGVSTEILLGPRSSTP